MYVFMHTYCRHCSSTKDKVNSNIPSKQMTKDGHEFTSKSKLSSATLQQKEAKIKPITKSRTGIKSNVNCFITTDHKMINASSQTEQDRAITTHNKR